MSRASRKGKADGRARETGEGVECVRRVRGSDVKCFRWASCGVGKVRVSCMWRCRNILGG